MLDLLAKVGNRRIILWGTGNTGNAFYEKYRNDLDIYACTCNEKEFKSIAGLKTIQWDEIDRQIDFIIVCSIYYEEIRRQLMVRGFEVNVDFIKFDIFEELYEGFRENKKLILAIGQCEIREMITALKRLKNFKKYYSMIYYNERGICEHGDLFDWTLLKEFMNIIGMADYIMLPSAISPQAKYDFQYIKSFIGDKCSVITISLFNFDSYWPQDIARERSVNKYYMMQKNMKLPAYVERDQVIEKLVDENYSVKKIMELISKEDYFKKEDVMMNHQNSLKRFRLTDRLSDVKIGDFIESNYNLVKLYCDRGHFNQNLLREYVRRILNYLGANESLVELQNMDFEDMFMRINELPIYPSTAAILNLEWINRGTLYRQHLYSGIRTVTFEEYMETFIEYCFAVKKTLQFC